MMSDPNKYTIGWICAIKTEFVAAQTFFDEKHGDLDSIAHCDNNNYALGRIGKHNVVMAVMPESEYGTTTAATVARDMLHSFPNIRFGLMVGIGGGAPSIKNDIRLGDVVVNTRGVFQYDYGKETQGSPFQTTGSLNKPPQLLLTAISALGAKYELEGHQLNERIEAAIHRYPRLRKKYSRPRSEYDRLFQSDIIHPGPGECVDLCRSGFKSPGDRGLRDEQEDDPTIHYGLVASANRLMKNPIVRDSLAADQNVLCFEMEAAGLANHFPCVVIRGICDYSDSHKNDKWQGFASMVAAAYAKELLYQILPSKVQAEIPVKEILNSIKDVTVATNDAVMNIVSEHHNDKIMRWLSPPDHSSNANLARERRHPGTGTWLLDSPLFQDWKSGLHKYMWLYGLVGCGKTVLSSAILDDLLSSDEHTTLAFFFDFNDPRKQTLDDLLRSLAAQLYQTGSKPAKELDNLFASYNNGSEKPDSRALSTCVDAMIKAAEPVFIIVDAMDECTQFQQMLQWLECSISDETKILVTGRPEQDLTAGLFRLFGNQNCVSLDKKAIDADIWSYVDAELKQRPYFIDMNLSSDVLDLIRDKIGNGADGMFRWAACQLDVLGASLSPRDIKTALKSLPNDLDETYDRMIGRIPVEKKPYAIRLLQFLIHTKRPLKVAEAVEVLATNIDIDPPEFSADGRLFKPHDILRYCPSLIIISETRQYWGTTVEEVHLAHFSVKEYLLKQVGLDLRNSSIAITRTCLAYLCDINGCDRSIEYEFPMAKYAAKYWKRYAVYSEYSDITTRSIIEFMKDETSFRRWTYLYEGSWKFQNASYVGLRLYYACRFNLEEAVRCLVAQGDDVNATNGRRYTPLQLAISRGNLKLVQLLVEKGAYLDPKHNKSRRPLTIASEVGNIEIVRLLLSQGAGINECGLYGGTALHGASRRRHVDVMQFLLENGADVNAWGRGPFRETALHSAMEHSDVTTNVHEVVQLLLDHGADVNSTDYDECTVLSRACMQGQSLGIVRLLLENGADVNADGDTLQIACSGGNLKVIELLLENGADINSADGEGYTALYAALLKRDPKVVQLLLDNGANVNTQHRQCGTPLHFALGEGLKMAAQMLHKKGARDEEGEEGPYRSVHRNRLLLSDVILDFPAISPLREKQYSDVNNWQISDAGIGVESNQRS